MKGRSAADPDTVAALRQRGQALLDARGRELNEARRDDGLDQEVMRRRFIADDARREALEPAAPRPPVRQTFLFAPVHPLRSCFACSTSTHTDALSCPRCGCVYS